jgi:hypothetical protein
MNINNHIVKQFISFKEYMEDICGFKVNHSDIICSCCTQIHSCKYRNGYILTVVNGKDVWWHVTMLGLSPIELRQEIRQQKINKLI